MTSLRRFPCLVALAVLCSPSQPASAQALRPVEAVVTPLVERDSVAAGSEVRTAIRVALPETMHVNSNQPRDPSLIPVVLTVDPPAGVTVLELVYPEPYNLEQIGSPEPLLVYDYEFVIGVRLAVDAASLMVTSAYR